ncbi:aminopeptidase P family protein [Anaerorhabdus sp.]|uniref:aminopeptidase P family protein n=1 Tax=Anaerorhabdus sp. TaxID=1872524 RepID=UPI002FCBAC55
MTVKENLMKLRDLMKQEGIDIFYIPTADYHQSEYLSEYFKTRKFMSGFTGSAGTLVVTMKEAGLWTDGRYFVQAAKQLKGSTIDLYKMGQEGVPTFVEFIEKKMPIKGVLGFDGRVVNAKTAGNLEKCLKVKEVTLKTDKDLVNEIWTDRPSLPSEPCFLLADKYTGVKTEDKIKRLQADMKEKNADVCVLVSLEDVAWLLNLRGFDIEDTPVALAFATVTKNRVNLFIDKKKLSADICKKFSGAKVSIRGYNDLGDELSSYKDKTILLCSSTISAYHKSLIDKSCTILDETSPVVMYRALKNKTEIKNIRYAHVKDGVAVTKFIYWVKNNVGNIEIDELSATKKLHELREAQENYIEDSFGAIVAYGPNAAMMHYSATEKSYSVLKNEGFLLVDSGGQYYEGTTDITRTITLGKLTQEEKVYYTATLRSMIRLAKANFLYGCTGASLDILSRGPIWDMDIDYQCGTGHGVGHVLGVHEGPQGFRWSNSATGYGIVPIEEGMIITDEPGVYIPNKLGIRIENELLAQKGKKNTYGQFMHFDTVTLAPIDLDPVLPELMSEDEIEFLNNYHAEVFAKISPFCTQKEKTWLKIQTRKIKKA